jgi:uncharacterized protein YndB with AHSA1/START domain
MTTRPRSLALRVERVLRAPQSEACRAYAEPEELARWWGPAGFTVPLVDVDLRVGGAYRIAMQPPDGDLFHLSGEYLEVDPPALLVYTFRWEPPDPDDRDTVVAMSFQDQGSSTELVVVQGVFATEERRELHEGGWTESLERLEELLATGRSPRG